MADSTQAPILFHCDGVDDGVLIVTKLEGREEVSRPYRFEVWLSSAEDKSVDLDKVLDGAAWIGIKQPVKLSNDKWGLKTFRWNGIISEIEVLDRDGVSPKYRAVLVPRIWKLSLNHQSQCFLDKQVPDIITEVLKESGISDVEVEAGARSYPERAFVMQYEETDLDFIHRWIEHEGLFYYFKQTEDGEKIVFVDKNGSCPLMEEPSLLSYNQEVPIGARIRDHEGADQDVSFYREPWISSLSYKRVRLPKTVKLNDYNWRKPQQPMKAEAEVWSKGVGTYYEYNNHYKDEKEGKDLAKIRAEEIACRDKRVTGKSDHRGCRAGHLFSLDFHPLSALNQEYLVCTVEHQATQDVQFHLGTASVSLTSLRYENTFTALPTAVPFRTQCETDWPAIKGVFHGKVDAATKGAYAEINDDAEYKVKLPIDMSDAKDGKASRFIRMAQPYSGAEMGMHFPLHAGTEVALGFVDGDPDRPLIIGAVPNAETKSPVVAGNQTQCKIQTGGGNAITMEDTGGAQRITMESPGAGTTFSIGEAFNPDHGFLMDSAGKLVQNITDNIETKGLADAIWDLAGNHFNAIGGNYDGTIKGGSSVHIYGQDKKTVLGDKIESVFGSEQKTIIGSEFKTNIGLKNELFLGGGIKINVSKQIDLIGAIKKMVTPKKEEKAAAYTGDYVAAKLNALNLSVKSANTHWDGGKLNLVLGGILTQTTGNWTIGCSKMVQNCGGTISIGSSGTYKVVGGNIKHKTSGGISANAGGLAVIKGGSVEIKSKGKAGVKGSIIKLG